LKLLNILVLLVSLAAVPASAQFSRMGDKNSVNLSWTQIDAPQTSNWQGLQLTNMFKLGTSGEANFVGDIGVGYVKSNATSANYGRAGVGSTVSLGKAYKLGEVAVSPYFRGAVYANSGNFQAQNHSYWSYEVEPGIIARIENIYGLVGYRYGEGFNADFGSTIQTATTGVGFDLTKNFAVEAKYDMNRGSYHTNTLGIGGVYKF
jgi:hypothetical protein